jgi:hypothetical protein
MYAVLSYSIHCRNKLTTVYVVIKDWMTQLNAFLYTITIWPHPTMCVVMSDHIVLTNESRITYITGVQQFPTGSGVISEHSSD